MKDKILSRLIGTLEANEIPYDSLMPRRVSNLLLVTSLYDYYTIIEDGKLSEMLYNEYLELDLRFTPSIERVSRAEDALELLRQESFDLIISMPRVGDMNIMEFSEAVHAIDPSLPMVLLSSSLRELSSLPPPENLPGVDSVFVWNGDVRLFLVIIKYIEDRYNAPHDTEVVGVKCVVLIEDSVQFYSSYLPMLYTEILNQTRVLTEDSVSRAQRVMRIRARPKVLLARNFEEGMALFEKYNSNLLGVIIDAAFPKDGKLNAAAGFEIARQLQNKSPETPILMQSDSQNADSAKALGLEFIDKGSPTLLGDLRNFMQNHLGFGDFVFTGPDNKILTRIPNLRALEWALQAIPAESIYPNISGNRFSIWLMARTEFELANAIRTILQEAHEPEKLKSQLLEVIRAFRQRSMSGIVVNYSNHTFESNIGFVRIGDGSLGGKGRGLAFLNSLIKDYSLANRFENVQISVPRTAVITTSVFDRFIQSSGLLSYALVEKDDNKITKAFLRIDLPADVVEDLWNFLQWVRYPLAVRSSSLLEDALYQPFAGIYKTYMIANNHPNPDFRLNELCDAIKMVFASTYHSDPKAYMESLPNRLEEEKMAVVIQQVIGRQYGLYFYPNIGGVGRSLNFYPVEGMSPEDGIVSVALGMGKTVVEGGRCFRFCPAYPKKPIQSFTPNDYLDNSQRSFLALDLSQPGIRSIEQEVTASDLVSLDLDVAERHGTLLPVASVYSPDNDAIYDGLSRKGTRLVTMAGLLKGNVMPLADITAFLLKVGSAASSGPIEIEFAATLSNAPSEPHHFACLQIRPLAVSSEIKDINIEDIDPGAAICISNKSLGNGLIKGISDLIYVRMENFDRSKTQSIADEIGNLNIEMRRQKIPFILIGPGRWGSADPWLGIPVKWGQISGVRCIVENDFADMHVDPSQGSHFFQNIMSFGIGYLTIGKCDYFDRAWLDQNESKYQSDNIRHISLLNPVEIILNGRKNFGVILKRPK